ncbi:thioredoxin [Halobacillus fulvus]|nr:thioredoxin [Halobacillus fulvus]
MEKLKHRNDALIFVHSPFCGTCHLAREMLTVVEEMYNEGVFYECNASLNPDFMREYQIESVPCLFIKSDGEMTDKIYAFHSVPYLFEKVDRYVKK